MAVIATGFFDGVHLGHREVINTLVSSARKRDEEAIVITFAQHPRAVLQQDACSLRLLTSPEEKARLLKEMGVDRVEVLPFSRGFASMGAAEYIGGLLAGHYGATEIVMGYDNHLGSDRRGPEELAHIARELGIALRVVPPKTDGTAISSTRIRNALSRGDVEGAARMLGREYSIRGVVVSGKQLGRAIGFPTANMRLYEPLKLIPAKGAYLTEVDAVGRRFYGMTNVGDIIETNIFDFSEYIYGLDIEIKLKKHLRDEKCFKSVDELQSALSADRELCRALCAGLPRL